MIITQKYVKTETKELVTSMLSKRNSISIKTPIQNKINLRKQNAGIVSNIVHSLDATNIALLVNNLINNYLELEVITIHDCFATHANNVEILKYQVKLAFLCI